MKTKAEHIEYLKEKGPFDLEGDAVIFNNEEIEMLEKWGHWYKGLTDGEHPLRSSWDEVLLKQRLETAVRRISPVLRR